MCSLLYLQSSSAAAPFKGGSLVPNRNLPTSLKARRRGFSGQSLQVIASHSSSCTSRFLGIGRSCPIRVIGFGWPSAPPNWRQRLGRAWTAPAAPILRPAPLTRPPKLRLVARPPRTQSGPASPASPSPRGVTSGAEAAAPSRPAGRRLGRGQGAGPLRRVAAGPSRGFARRSAARLSLARRSAAPCRANAARVLCCGSWAQPRGRWRALSLCACFLLLLWAMCALPGRVGPFSAAGRLSVSCALIPPLIHRRARRARHSSQCRGRRPNNGRTYVSPGEPPACPLDAAPSRDPSH